MPALEADAFLDQPEQKQKKKMQERLHCEALKWVCSAQWASELPIAAVCKELHLHFARAACVTKLAVQLSAPSGNLTTHCWPRLKRPCSPFNVYHLHFPFYWRLFSSFSLRHSLLSQNRTNEYLPCDVKNLQLNKA